MAQALIDRGFTIVSKHWLLSRSAFQTSGMRSAPFYISVHTSMCSVGFFGNPGIRRISPAMASNHFRTVVDCTISLIWNSKLLTAPYIFGSAEKEYCVLAIQTGVMADTHLLYQFNNLAGMETVSHHTLLCRGCRLPFSIFTCPRNRLFCSEGHSGLMVYSSR